MLAQRAGQAGLVRQMLARGADVNASNELGITALMSSIRSEHPDATAIPRVVEALLVAGANVTACDHDGTMSLHHFTFDSHAQPWAVDVARLLLGAGADGRAVNAAGETPAQCVSAGAHGGEVHRLLLGAAGA